MIHSWAYPNLKAHPLSVHIMVKFRCEHVTSSFYGRGVLTVILIEIWEIFFTNTNLEMGNIS
jgi:hypothetical protein